MYKRLNGIAKVLNQKFLRNCTRTNSYNNFEIMNENMNFLANHLNCMEQNFCLVYSHVSCFVLFLRHIKY